ncbi:fungal-specific transcription factor domain-containing protein [Microdochium trichocladiopsis]|uniref:Fungal-specific transcription factor domain-containing protein n=1 Tax=Microdochium trichocladiopsis TaxID=1682393 RepID=A0A9P8YA45_9PEZI|nr:fungal-specific transcription factor domain-containing protein [Microdochium trichocladiopsis]KAH7031455.1 fungal-specific transcription factor domain-containing protein [Microdochium trichocladiopsis]
MATSSFDNLQVVPSLSRACSRCHARKVKCDLRVPRCTACEKQNDECNITECVAYSHSTVQTLLDELHRLRGRLDVAESRGPREQSMTEQQVRSEAEELGVLAVGGPRRHDMRASYVGSATGTTFARIFFKQLGLSPLPRSGDFDAAFEHNVTCQYASLPPEKIAIHLMRTFIAQVHTFWPVLQLPSLRKVFKAIYHSPSRSSTRDKFKVFMVMALASALCADDKAYQSMADLNSSSAYFQTAVRLFSSIADGPRDLETLQCLLLIGLWMLEAGWDTHVDDIWHHSRYIMSVAIELGIHRRVPGWDVSQDDLETRNRVWWCTYNLERCVAVINGRVLSIREHAIDAPQPTTVGDDRLMPAEAHFAPAYSRVGSELFLLAIRLRRIGGRILESVYIARGPDGRAPLTSFKQICDEFDSLRKSLDGWKQSFDALDIKETREHSELKIEYCQLLLIMHRPSPTFMIPSAEMIGVCSKAVSSIVRHWRKLLSQYGVSAVSRCSRQLHSMLMVGLAGLYCDWQSTKVLSARSNLLYRHGTDVDMCVDLIERSLAQLRPLDKSFVRCRDLLQAARSRVYGANLNTVLNAHPEPPEPDMGPDTGLSNLSEPLGFYAGGPDSSLNPGHGMESYFNQISGYFDSTLVGLDENLTIWHDAFLDEIRTNRLAGD